MKPQLWNQTEEQRQATLILQSVSNKFYICTHRKNSSVKILKCRETGKEVISAVTSEEFYKKVISFLDSLKVSDNENTPFPSL